MSRHTLSFNSRNFLKRIDAQRQLRSTRASRRFIRKVIRRMRCSRALQNGSVKLVVASPREQAVTAILGPGDVFGEGCLVNRSLRKSTATAI